MRDPLVIHDEALRLLRLWMHDSHTYVIHSRSQDSFYPNRASHTPCVPYSTKATRRSFGAACVYPHLSRVAITRTFFPRYSAVAYEWTNSVFPNTVKRSWARSRLISRRKKNLLGKVRERSTNVRERNVARRGVGVDDRRLRFARLEVARGRRQVDARVWVIWMNPLRWVGESPPAKAEGPRRSA